jgi:hypothetical protein
MHRWLCEQLDGLRRRRGQRLNVLAPRGNAKSSWASLAYPLWCVCHGTEPYILLTADTKEQACKYLDSIRAELDGNDSLAETFPDVAGPGPVWRADRLRTRNGVQLEALGTGSKARGRKAGSHRPSLIIVDDPQNLEHILSPLQRGRSWEWLTKDACNAGSPRTNIVVLGTALHRECIVYRLQSTVGWRSRLWRSVESWPARMDLWNEWEAILHNHDDPGREAAARAFYDQRRAEMDAGASVLWPEREPLYALMLLRAAVGPAAFGSEKQNDPINPDLCEWPAEYFEHPAIWFRDWPVDLACQVLALDPSKGRDARLGDYSAYVRLGVSKAGLLYVEADLQRRTAEAIIAAGVSHCQLFRPEGFCVETNTFQELLAPLFAIAAREARVVLPLYGIENAVAKAVRIRRLGTPLAERRFRFRSRSPGTALLVQQLRDFPQGDHDDGPDALEMAHRMAIGLLEGRQGNGPRRLVV